MKNQAAHYIIADTCIHKREIMMGVSAKIFNFTARYSHINWALIDQIIVSGANVLTGILLARFLGVEGFGSYALAWAALLLVASIHLPLVVGSMMSIGPKQSEADAPSYYGAVIVQNLIISIAGFFLVFVGVEFGGRLFQSWDIQQLGLPLGIAAFATIWHEFCRRYFFTRGRPRAAFVIDATRYTLQIGSLVATFVFAHDALNVEAAVWILSISAALPAVVSLKFIGAIEYRISIIKQVTGRHYHASKWMVMSEPLEWASEYVFTFTVGTMIGPAAVGALRASQNVAALTNILFLALMNIVPAGAARHLQDGGFSQMSGYLRRVAIAAGLLTATICLVLAIAPAFWLDLLFGADFSQYGELLRWWSLYYLVNFFALPLRAGFRALEYTRPVFNARLLGALFAAVSAGILISLAGMQGAVIGAVITKGISTWWLFVQYQRSPNASHLLQVPRRQGW